MALQSVYQQFLASPNSSHLASNASLHYITTLVTLNGPTEIIKHLGSQSHEFEKKEERFLDVVEGPDSLAVETHTTLEFQTGGGAYLPGLDDNFLADRTVTFPIVHIVQFDSNGKILQIRQSWDQGSLLKLIDVIGKTGRNWPIRDGKDQLYLISSSIKSAGKSMNGAAKDTDEPVRSRGNSTNVTRDPHASLSLFAPRDKSYDSSLPAVVVPRASAKPAPRDYHDLFVGNDSDNAPAGVTSPEPKGFADIASPKAGAGKNYAPSRLFDTDENSPPSPEKNPSTDHYLRANPAKYQHFNFADGSDPQDAPHPTSKNKTTSKHGSQWNFDDFNTPQKVVPSKLLRTNDVRHWGDSDNETETNESPMKMKRLDKPRKDAETHFEFVDDGTPEGERRLVGRPRGAGQNDGLGLYKNNLYDDENGGSAGGEERSTGLANVKDRRKDFDPHFSMKDEPSPVSKPITEKISDVRAKAVKMMDANWSTYDRSPNQKENVPITERPGTGPGKGPLSESTKAVQNDQNRGIAVAGDGMGSRKAAGARELKEKGIAIGGDGMGGKRGAGRAWGFGDESGGEEEGEAGGQSRKNLPRNLPGKKQTQQATGGEFWDF
ncbi:hypothetical protein B7494_g7253 [Chlorociboria aeruginascens]|nr:hypothetical protein B7494_g7253 [Chlorociboria aeruginascens]